MLAAEKDAGLTGEILRRHRADYYYKGYPDNGVTAKVEAQKLGLDNEDPGLVEEPTLVVSTGTVRKTVSTRSKMLAPWMPWP